MLRDSIRFRYSIRVIFAIITVSALLLAVNSWLDNKVEKWKKDFCKNEFHTNSIYKNNLPCKVSCPCFNSRSSTLDYMLFKRKIGVTYEISFKHADSFAVEKYSCRATFVLGWSGQSRSEFQQNLSEFFGY